MFFFALFAAQNMSFVPRGGFYFHVSLYFSSLSLFSKVFLYFSSCTIMANLGNALVNVTPESDSDNYSSSVGVKNSDLMGIFYGLGSPIHAQNAPNDSSGSGLDSLDNDDDLV